MRKLIGAVLLTASMAVAGASSASAWSDTDDTYMGGSRWIQANAWHCNFFVDKCDWKTSSKAYKNSGLSTTANMTWIKNVAEITAHGGTISISLSKHPSATISGTSSTKSVSWTNYGAWISDFAGGSDPSWTTTYLTTCSNASAYSSSLGVKGGAVACSLG
jgi:hypothetical protein